MPKIRYQLSLTENEAESLHTAEGFLRELKSRDTEDDKTDGLSSCLAAIGRLTKKLTKIPARNIGNSILPSSGPSTYEVKTGKHGAFQVRALDELDTHGLYIRRADVPGDAWVLIAMHPNGHSCEALAKRTIRAWETGLPTDIASVTEQAQYIVDCGGMTMSIGRFELIATHGSW